MAEYDVLLADPPWEYRVWNEDTGSGRSASKHYKTMSIDEICTLPVPPLCASNCALFLWATWPNILDAFRVIEAWGFTYRTLAWEWVKAKKNGAGFHMGMGHYTRANPEPCLLAVSGRMVVVARDVPALIYSPVRAHSRKPNEQYAKIERLYPNMRYLELFARQRRDGWTSIGHGIDGLDIKAALAQLILGPL